jgi:hypothetical protein
MQSQKVTWLLILKDVSPVRMDKCLLGNYVAYQLAKLTDMFHIMSNILKASCWLIFFLVIFWMHLLFWFYCSVFARTWFSLITRLNWNSHFAMVCETTGELLGFQSKERVGACNWVCWLDCGFIWLEKTFKVSSFFRQSHVLPLYPLPLFLSLYMWLTWLILWPVPTYRMEVSSYSLGWTGTRAYHSCSVHYWLCRLISNLTRYWNLWFITIRWDKSPKVYVFCLLRSLEFQA